MDIVNLIISLLSGVVGGNLAGAAMKDNSLGTAGNTVIGLLGGGLGSYILQALNILSHTGGSLDITSIIANIGSGGISGAILLVIASFLKNALSKKV